MYIEFVLWGHLCWVCPMGTSVLSLSYGDICVEFVLWGHLCWVCPMGTSVLSLSYGDICVEFERKTNTTLVALLFLQIVCKYSTSCMTEPFKKYIVCWFRYMIAKGYGTRISCLYPSHVLRDYEVQMNMFFCFIWSERPPLSLFSTCNQI